MTTGVTNGRDDGKSGGVTKRREDGRSVGVTKGRYDGRSGGESRIECGGGVWVGSSHVLCAGETASWGLVKPKLVRLLVLYTLRFVPVRSSTAYCGVFAEYILYIYSIERSVTVSVLVFMLYSSCESSVMGFCDSIKIVSISSD